jgi:hypothetical protein
MTALQSEALHARRIENFKEKIGAITTPSELINDFETYSFVMRAFDLEEQIFGKAMLRKILESDADDATSLVSRLTDDRFSELHTTLGFVKSGEIIVPDFTDTTFQDNVVDKYLEREFIGRQAVTNVLVGDALDFRIAALEVNSWYDVLKNVGLSEFFRVALGMPSETVRLTVEKQKELFESKYNVEDLKNEDSRERLIEQYLIRSEISNLATQGSSNPILNLFRPISNNTLTGQFTPITLSIPAVKISASRLFLR